MSKYIEAWDATMKGLSSASPGITKKCGICPEFEDGEEFDEGSFSASSCDGCNTYLAGDRYIAHAWEEGKEGKLEALIHLSVCQDCLLFMANGDEPEGWSDGC